VTAVDEPDVGFISAAGDLLGSVDAEELGVERPGVQQEGKSTGATLLGSVAHSVRASF
jgi:hypothetical protein